MSTALVLNHAVTEKLIRERRERGIDGFDEVWEGVYVVSPLANLEHQWIAGQFTSILDEVVVRTELGRVYPGANVSDRDDDWMQNFRVPDVVVVLKGGKARDCDTHLCGGPDFLIEILSLYDKSYDKLDFYAKIGVRELLLVDPDSRGVELFRLAGDELVPAGTSTKVGGGRVTSSVVPLAFEHFTTADTPRIVVLRTDGKPGEWSV